jgi:general secretion pathway protein J
MNKITNKKGFTLIEIIIAIGILAAMTLTMSQISTSVVESKNRSEKRVETRHATSIALSKLTDDLRMAFIADKTFHGNDSFYLTGFIGDGTSINFSTMSNVHYIKNQNDTDQSHVGYKLKTDDTGNFILIRRQTPYLMEKLEEGGQGFVLMRDIKEITIEYYDSNKKEWKDKWDTESISFAGRLPQMVKVKLTALGETKMTDEDERKEYHYELVVPVAMYKQKVSF